MNTSRLELTFPCYFQSVVERFPDRHVLVDYETGTGVTFTQHDQDVRTIARWMADSMGLGPGRRFGVLASNGRSYFQLWHAALCGGGIIVPLNQRLSVDELAYIIEDAELDVCFADASFSDVLEAAVARSGRTVRRVHLPFDLTSLDAGDEPLPVLEDEPVAQMYTGGTTGRPKGVVLSSRALILNHIHEQLCSLQPPHLRYLQHAPMFHVGTLLTVVTGAVTAGTTYWLPSFDTEKFIDIVAQCGVEATVMLPTLIHRVLNHLGPGDDSLSSLKYISYGGAPMPPALLARLLEMCPNAELAQTYGMTETAGRITMLSNADHRRADTERLLSVGQVVPGVRLRIERAEGGEAARGEVGEICARGGNIMLEYWKMPEVTAETMREGWFHTGDLGKLDADGYLYIVDRKNDLIITGGENVYSVEVEQVLLQYPGLEQAVVFGVPDDEWGERVVAVVVVSEGHDIEPEEVRTFCREHIAGYKVPRDVVTGREPLPVSPTNKILKREVREQFIADVDSVRY